MLERGLLRVRDRVSSPIPNREQVRVRDRVRLRVRVRVWGLGCEGEG